MNFGKLCSSRRSTVNFKKPSSSTPTPTKSQLDSIVLSTLRTPTGFNLQPYTVVLLDGRVESEQKIKESLAQSSAIGPGNAKRFIDCTILAVFLTDLNPSGPSRMKRVIEIEESEGSPRRYNDGYIGSLPVLTDFLVRGSRLKDVVLKAVSDSGYKGSIEVEGVREWGNKSVGMAVMTFVYSCCSHNLGTCVMEGFDGRRIRSELGVPSEGWGVPACVAVGDCDDENIFGKVDMTKRLDVDEVFFKGGWGKGYKVTSK